MVVPNPGLIALFGSGETAATSGVVYDRLAAGAQAPLRIAILETPAGFQTNSERVAGKVAEFLQVRLQNAKPDISILPARKRGTPFDPDAPEISVALHESDLIYLGAGSPSYTVRQLAGSLAWQRATARHRHGAAIVTASAATIALGTVALPVYEIYKVGDDPHWQPGLDFFGPYGLAVAFIPHWNNTEGGADLDTSHCYMGSQRYQLLLDQLPSGVVVVGIDEHTTLLVDLAAGEAQVLGRGGVTIRRDGQEKRFERGTTLTLDEIGTLQMPDPAAGLPAAVWAEMQEQPEPEAQQVSDEALALLEARQSARARRDWAAADQLRAQLAALGWSVRDTPEGPLLEPVT